MFFTKLFSSFQNSISAKNGHNSCLGFSFSGTRLPSNIASTTSANPRAVANPRSRTVSSLLRSPSIRRALSSASPGGSRGVSFIRAPSAVAAAIGGEGGANVRRGLGLPTVPRRHLCAPQQSRDLTSTSIDQCDALYEEVRATKVSLLDNKDLLPRIIESSSNACDEFSQKYNRRTWMVGVATFGGFFAGSWMRKRKMDDKRELRNGTDENLPGNGTDENLPGNGIDENLSE